VKLQIFFIVVLFLIMSVSATSTALSFGVYEWIEAGLNFNLALWLAFKSSIVMLFIVLIDMLSILLGIIIYSFCITNKVYKS